MLVKIKSLEWLEKNCKKYNNGDYYIAGLDNVFTKNMLYLCNKELKIDECNFYANKSFIYKGYWKIEEWMYWTEKELVRQEKIRLIRELIK